MEKKIHGRWYRSILCLLSMASVFLIITAISLNFNMRTQNEPPTSAQSGENPSQMEEKTPSEQPVNAKPSEIVLREHEGIIGVFADGNAEPFLTVNIRVSSLPGTDAALIRQGIAVESMEALQRLLEDYES
ncbi:MAG: hypothetical protein IKU17_07680 [Clostridia bacterium]|nr:hypothetical protein [Clostridia bacterium]